MKKTIEIITSEEAQEIIECANRQDEGLFTEEPRYGKFLLQEDGRWVAIDNEDGYAWTEDFQNREVAEMWLLDEGWGEDGCQNLSEANALDKRVTEAKRLCKETGNSVVIDKLLGYTGVFLIATDEDYGDTRPFGIVEERTGKNGITAAFYTI